MKNQELMAMKSRILDKYDNVLEVNMQNVKKLPYTTKIGSFVFLALNFRIIIKKLESA